MLLCEAQMRMTARIATRQQPDDLSEWKLGIWPNWRSEKDGKL
jgi:hypothetical protein